MEARWCGRALMAALLCIAAPVAGQSVEAGAVQVRFSGRVQFQYNTSNVEGVPSTFEQRRIRPGLRLTIDDWIEGQIETEVAQGKLSVRNAYMNLAVSPGVELRFGQYKMPFGLVQLTSSTEIPMIERGVRIRGLEDALLAEDAGAGSVLTEFGGEFLLGEQQTLLEALGYQGYDMGAMVHGSRGRLGYAVGAFNGAGMDQRDANGAKTVAGRLTWSLAAGDAPLTLGAAGIVHDVEVAGDTRRGSAVEVDLELGDFRRPGLHVLAEFDTGENLAVEETFLAAQAAAGWYMPLEGERVEGWELVGRASWGDPSTDREGDAGVLLTPGVNLYFAGKNRLMANWDVFVPQGDRFETRNALRFQAQLVY